MFIVEGGIKELGLRSERVSVGDAGKQVPTKVGTVFSFNCLLQRA